MNRRKFFKSLAQGGIFTALAGTTVYLLAKKKTTDTNECDFDFICQNCKKKRHCQLPEASKLRQQNFVNK